jgi:glycosyltransferase involved in cell wall biosynthesis
VKIVFDGRTLRPRRTGVGYFVERLLRALMEDDRANEYLVLLNDESVWATWKPPENFRAMPVRADYESHPWGDLWERFSLPRLLKRERADLFHGAAFRVPHTRCCCPTIVTIYDLTCWRCGEDYPWRFRHYMRWQIRRSCKWATGIIATSQATANDLQELLGVAASKVQVIPGAADERFRPAESPDRARLARIHLALAQPYILTVGTIEPRKRIELLVAAYEKARARGSLPHSLIVVGRVGWKAEASLRAMRESSAAASIHHLGYVAEGDLVAIYQGCDLFVCASRYEGFGLPPLEAMACGRPVVVTAGGALVETVGDGGVVVDAPGADPLADAMLAVLTDKARCSAMARKALDVAASFSWRTAAEGTIAFYERIARAQTMS